MLFVVFWEKNLFTFWKKKKKKKKKRNGHSSRVFCLANDLDQELVFSGSWDMMIMIWNAVEQKFVGKVAPAHSDAVTQLLYTNINGFEYLISGSSDRSVVLYRKRSSQGEPQDEVAVFKSLPERSLSQDKKTDQSM